MEQLVVAASTDSAPEIDLVGTWKETSGQGAMVAKVAAKGPDAFAFSLPFAPKDAKPLLFPQQKSYGARAILARFADRGSACVAAGLGARSFMASRVGRDQRGRRVSRSSDLTGSITATCKAIPGILPEPWQ